MKKVLAVDVDGVLAKLNPNAGVEIGEIIDGALETLAKFKEAGWYIILYTTRPDEHTLRKWCNENFPGIFDAINCNPLDVMKYGIVAAKPYADLYLDDRAWPNNGIFNWNKLNEDLKNIL